MNVEIRNLAVSGLLLVAATSWAVPAEAQGLFHSIMRGTVVEKSEGVVTVCVGRADGAKLGQQLAVVRIMPTGIGAKGGSAWRMRDVGRVQLDEIVDDHFARATVLSGDPQKNDLVELRVPQGGAK